MTSGQYLALCLIGAVAVVAYWQSLQTAKVLAGWQGAAQRSQGWTA